MNMEKKIRDQTTSVSQRGSIMLISLIFLVLLGIMGLTSMHTSKLEMRMSGNEQVKVSAHEAAQSLIDAVIADPTMTPVVGDVGYVLCTAGEPGCDRVSITMPAGPLQPEVTAQHLGATGELQAIGPPPRGTGFSADFFDANHYRLTATYDRADEGLGRASVTQGIVILTMKAL
jgi:hypothetical protein